AQGASGSGLPQLSALREIITPQPYDWTALGFPHYSGAMTYTSHFESPPEFSRFWLTARADQRDPFEVRVNGKSVGQACWQPWRVELTDAVKPGRNKVEIIVANTLINRIEG